MTVLETVSVVVGIAGFGVGIWQLRVGVLERRDSRRLLRVTGVDKTPEVFDGMPVTPPLGRLPAQVLSRKTLLTELQSAMSRKRRAGKPGVWVLTGMGGIGKSTAALSLAATARRRPWAVWWVNAADTVSLRRGTLEILLQLDAPEIVLRAVRDGSSTAADRFWDHVERHAGHALLIFDTLIRRQCCRLMGCQRPRTGTVGSVPTHTF
ncbi:AAA family ATPase [Streptomyces avermitilis]|uniref:AAA family ATPase n=1 Tax=Streptomyces avermitilis TaxID=33903 RepID=UPI0033D133FC